MYMPPIYASVYRRYDTPLYRHTHGVKVNMVGIKHTVQDECKKGRVGNKTEMRRSTRLRAVKKVNSKIIQEINFRKDSVTVLDHPANIY